MKKVLLVLMMLLPVSAFGGKPKIHVGTLGAGNFAYIASYSCPVCSAPHLESCSPDTDPDELENCENDNQEKQERYDECMQQYYQCQQQQDKRDQEKYCQEYPDDSRCKDR